MLRPLTLITLAGLAVLAGPVRAAETAPLPTKAEVEALIAKGQAWLLAQQQPNGAFVPGNKFMLGISLMAANTLASAPVAIPATDPRLQKTLTLMNTFRQKDGGFYVPDEGLGNYCTSLTLMVLTTTKTGDPAVVKAAQDFLLGNQNTDEGSLNKGGMGYGSRGKGHEDLSNTSYALQALRASGIPATDPRMVEAVKFLERCQDLSSNNKGAWVKNTGGAVYGPDESKALGSQPVAKPAATDEKPTLAPYGSMTYALISDYLILDVKPDDPRVAAAVAWVRDNYQFDANPGMRQGQEKEGLFYYYGLMAKTFDLLKLSSLDLKGGTKADWRADLFASIKAKAQPVKLDGGGEGVLWINQAERWGEGMPHLATCYMLQALKRIHASLP
jgi:squalene-hopene/tetraprenyl-beta-curcumene cyclase